MSGYGKSDVVCPDSLNRTVAFRKSDATQYVLRQALAALSDDDLVTLERDLAMYATSAFATARLRRLLEVSGHVAAFSDDPVPMAA